MKKLLLMVAIGITGYVSAKNLKVSKLESVKLISEVVSGGYYNVSVATSCGASYSQKMWFDVPPTKDSLSRIANAINIALCNEEGGEAAAVKAKTTSID